MLRGFPQEVLLRLPRVCGGFARGLRTGFAFSAAGPDAGCGLSSYSPISDVLTHGN